MRIVLIGGHGQLGWELQAALPILGDVVALGREEIDLAEPTFIPRTLAELQPQLIINAAAFTEVDLAESQIDLAMKVNAEAPGVLAETARKLGAVFIHYSTDYVFNGRGAAPYIETDLPLAINSYGQSKLLGEHNVQQAGDAYLIFRTSWVYSLRGNSFVNKVLGWARRNRTLRIVNDQISNPTWARALAECTASALTGIGNGLLEKVRSRRGIYHLAGSGFTSRYEWAKHILAFDPRRTEQLVQSIEPVTSEEFSTPARRPLFTALDCSKFERTFGLHPPRWEESLQVAMTS